METKILKNQFTNSRKFVFLCLIGLLMMAVHRPTELPAALGSLTFQTAFDNSLVDVAKSDKRHLEILITAPESAKDIRRERLPLNIALVIDKSGSMAERGKINYVKRAAESMLKRLRPADRFSIITYSNQAEVLIPSTSFEDFFQASTLISGIRAYGGTNMSDGMTAGYQQVQRYSSSRTINRVMLLSDGLANKGITHPVRLGDIVQKEANNGISLSTFGVGLDFNEDLMASLAENGRGMYYFMDHPEQIPTILAKEFQLTEQVVATGIRVELELDKDMVLDKVYANKYDVKGNRLIINGGDLSVGERRRYQIKFQPPSLNAGSYSVGDVRLSYTPAGGDQVIITHKELHLHYQPNITKIDTYKDQGVIERSSVFLVQYARDDAAKATEQGNIQQAQQILSQAQTHLQGKVGNSAKLRKEQLELDNYAAALKSDMSHQQRSRLQKAVKYRKHMVEGC